MGVQYTDKEGISNPIDALEAKCSNEKKAELGKKFVECSAKGQRALYEELFKDLNVLPENTKYCEVYETAVRRIREELGLPQTPGAQDAAKSTG